jgi:hypothetical protein
LEEANVLNKNVVKDGQIIYEEQVNGDQETNGDKLTSKTIQETTYYKT